MFNMIWFRKFLRERELPIDQVPPYLSTNRVGAV